MEIRYDLTGLTFAQLFRLRVALDLNIHALEDLLHMGERYGGDTMAPARNQWLKDCIVARGLMERIDTAQARPKSRDEA